MENSEVSQHEVEVYRVLRSAPDRWFTNSEVADLVDGVRPRTVRAKTAKFVQLGLVDVAEIFPGHRYRWSEMARQRNAGYLLRLDKAADVLGVKIP